MNEVNQPNNQYAPHASRLMSEADMSAQVVKVNTMNETPKQIDMDKANSLIDEYLAGIRNPDKMPSYFSRTWLEFAFQRHGLIDDPRKLKFGEAHSLWYACLILTKRIMEVTKAERGNAYFKNKPATNATIKQLRNKRSTNFFSTILNQILENQ